LGNTLSHIDTYQIRDTLYPFSTRYVLVDLTRQDIQNLHGHAGRMTPGEAIITIVPAPGTDYFYVAQDSDNSWADRTNQGPAVDAHVNAGFTYDYALHAQGVNSSDDAGTSMLSVVNVPFCTDNAGWDGAEVLFCAPWAYPSLAAALDAVAHEWGHGFTELAPGERRITLGIGGEAGALNEAFSDWFGLAVERSKGVVNWTMGEKVHTIRSLQDPHLYRQPAWYQEPGYWYWTEGCSPDPSNDLCGVHTNSGVGNKMFYLLANGGTFNGITVAGLGVETAMRIAMSANLDYWVENETYAGAREGMILAASGLPPGIAGHAVNQVKNAWGAVRVGLPAPVSVQVATPNGGETWPGGLVQTIRWFHNGGPGPYVRLDLFKAGALSRTIATSAPIGSNGQGSYVWTVPATQAAGADYRVRISSTSTPTIDDWSDVAFAIAAPTITVTPPNGGEIWRGGLKQTIRWTSTGNPGGYVKLELFKGDALSRTIASSVSRGTNGAGAYTWTVPATQLPGTEYRIKVTSTSTPAVLDWSDEPFTIAAPTVTVTTPNGGETWPGGLKQTIRWSLGGDPGGYIKVDLYKGAALSRTIISGAARGTNGGGSYSWTVPATQAPGDDYRMKITSTSIPAVTDWSDAPFTIAAPTIAVVEPANTAVWFGGDKRDIRWVTTGNPGGYVRLELFQGAALVRGIISSTSIGTNGQGRFAWTVPPGLPTGDYRIKVTSTSIPAVNDFNDGSLAIIAPTVAVTSPNGGDTWQGGTRQTVTWTWSGIGGPYVRIDLYAGTTSVRTLTTSAALTAGAFAWTVPATQMPRADYRIKISSTTTTSVLDWSDAPFAIAAPTLTVTTPNGGETWTRGTSQTIRWTYSGNPGAAVKIELFKGTTLNRTISSSAPLGSGGLGSYPWTIPSTQTIGADYRIKVTSTSTTAVSDFDDAPFTIAYP